MGCCPSKVGRGASKLPPHATNAAATAPATAFFIIAPLCKLKTWRIVGSEDDKLVNRASVRKALDNRCLGNV